MTALEEFLDHWQGRCIPEKYFHLDPRFRMSANNYKTSGRRVNGLISLPTHIPINHKNTPYFLVLSAGTVSEVALFGFQAEDGCLDCRQIQGRTNQYRTLTSLDWDKGLIDAWLVIGREVGAKELHIIPSALICPSDPSIAERLYNRYDRNALHFGFRYSEKQRRYILDID